MKAPDVRPLDPLRSIKAKLGVLVLVTVSVSSFLVYYGLVLLGWLPRFTLPVAVLMALGITQLLAHGMTSPLRRMTEAARAMARGDYSRRVHTRSRDEVGELAAAFNRMAADLEAADLQRRDLIAHVSHELRTPVSALHAVLENLVDGVARPDPATLRTALAQTARLGRLVGELLDLSRLDAGTQPLAPVEVALAPLVDAAVAEAQISTRDIAYAVHVTPPDLRGVVDPARLHQVLANLLDNAARHSPPGGVVTVAVAATHDGLRLEVSDDGPGIPPQDRERVFDRFQRGSTTSVSSGSTHNATDGGTGLGLAIARWAVDLHGGRIAVLDRDGAPGARFVVDLPTMPQLPQLPQLPTPTETP